MEQTVWILDDDPAIRWVLEQTLAQDSLKCLSFSQGQELLDALDLHPLPSLVITDIRMPGMDGLTLLQQLQQQYPELPVIVMTGYSDLDSTVSAYQHGAFDYLAKPFDLDEVQSLIHKALHQHQETQPQQIQLSEQSRLIGQSPAMQTLFRTIGKLSRSSVSVLITGPSGSGKERVAEALHQHSPRSDGPFIALNMAAIPMNS